MTRSVEEWIGATADSAIPARVRLRVFRAYDGKCYLSGRKIGAGDAWDCDHVIAIVNGGENRERNLAPVLKAPHREKTKADVAIKAKAERLAKKHLGIWPKGRGFSDRNRKFDGSIGLTKSAQRRASTPSLDGGE